MALPGALPGRPAGSLNEINHHVQQRLGRYDHEPGPTCK